MNEIYWITRFDSIYGVFVTFIIIGIIGIISFIVWYILSNADKDKEGVKRGKKGIILAGIPLLIGILGTIFIPTTKEALLIYGVGGTIDYIKSNDTAKKIPDKAIKALDKFLDEYNKDTNKNNNN